MLKEYEAADISNKDRLIMAWGYSYIGEKQKAIQCISHHTEVFSDNLDKIKYYNALKNIYTLLKDNDKTIEAYKDYTQAIYDISAETLNNELQFADDFQDLNYNHTRHKTYYIICIFSLLALLTLAGSIHHLNKNEKNKLKQTIRHKEEEKKSTYPINNDINHTLEKRLHLINQLFLGYSFESTKLYLKAENDIKKYFKNKNDVIRDNRYILTLLHPELFTTVNNHNLSNEELDYISLYAMGLNGKEISELFGSSSHYNSSSIIRKKLGLNASDTNLSLYIKSLMQEESQPDITQKETDS